MSEKKGNPYLRCPNCGTNHKLSISVRATRKIVGISAGSFDLEYPQSFSYSDDSEVTCGNCEHKYSLQMFYGPGDAYPEDSPVERANRAVKTLGDYMPGVEGDLDYVVEQLLIDLMYYFGVETVCKIFTTAGFSYNQAAAKVIQDEQNQESTPLTNEEFAETSMRLCPFCGEEARESTLTEDNAPVQMYCVKCPKEWRITWKHVGYEEVDDDGHTVKTPEISIGRD